MIIMIDDSQARVLIVDDDASLCATLHDFLSAKQYTVNTVSTANACLKHLEHVSPDIILLDQRLPDMEGISVCQKIASLQTDAKIIFITAYPSHKYAVRAMKSGAFDYLSKPFELDELSLLINNALEHKKLEIYRDICTYKEKNEYSETIVGSSPAHRELMKTIDLAAKSNVNLFITGETGVGKNVVAREIHHRKRIQKPMITVNCAAIPDHLVESEFFGHEKGAFTGAVATRKGVFELAHGGTLLLDEIGDMPFHLQSKLLNVLEEKKIRRVGGKCEYFVDVQVIALTNHNIEEAISQRKFRSDLYYRLSTMTIVIPPLRDRTEDIGVLCQHFLKQKKIDTIEIPPDEMRVLQQYQWPGNIRELKNIIDRAILLSAGSSCLPSKLLKMAQSQICIQNDDHTEHAYREIEPLDAMEKRAIAVTFHHFKGCKSKASKALGISLNTLKKKLRDFEIEYDG